YPAGISRMPGRARLSGRDYLASRGETMLLDHEGWYPPIPTRLVSSAFETTRLLVQRLPSLNLPAEPIVVSMSYVGHQAHSVYWDVVWPQLKYGMRENRGWSML